KIMRLKKSCTDTLSDPQYWQEVSNPSLLSYLIYRKEIIPQGSLKKESEHLRYRVELERILACYKPKSQVYKKIKFSALASEIGNINTVDDNDDVNNNNLIQSFSELSDNTLSGDDDDDFNSYETWGSKRAVSCNTKIDRARTVIQDFKPLGKSKEVILILGKRKQEHHIEEDSQRARHLIEILKWSIVDHDFFVEVGWRDTQLNEISTPQTKTNLAISVLQNHISSKLHFAAKTLKALESKKKLSIIAFVVEFERDGFEHHKDDVVIVAEAIHEFNQILSLVHNLLEEEVNQTQLHYGLVNLATIHLSMLEPVHDEKHLKLPIKFNYKLKMALPKLSNEAVKLWPFKTKQILKEKGQNMLLRTRWESSNEPQ
ncbi:15375_t:CDS:2, partial [Gigaspora margarita]